MTTVYTDGACSGNPGPGGWAWAVPGGRFRSGAEAHTTNQRMELLAVLDAVTTFDGPLEIVSDSTYVIHCFRDRWWEKWLAKGWVNSQKKPVANRDLWEPLVEAYRGGIATHAAGPNRLKFRWVKGHSNDAMNDVVDRLAVEAALTQSGRSGDDPPDELGPADLAGIATHAAGIATHAAGASSDPRVPEGRKLLVVGHKPPQLGGYERNLFADGVVARLAEILVAKHELHPDVVVLTGLGLGAEQLAAEAAAAAGVPYVAVLPYPDPDSVWPPASQEHFRELLAGAAGQILLQTKAPESKQKAGGALRRRDEWLYRNADEAVAIWDGEDDVVGRMVRSLYDKLSEEEVWVVAP